MKNNSKVCLFLAGVTIACSAYATPDGGPFNPGGGYVLCNNGNMVGWLPSPSQSTYQNAIDKCNLNGGGVAGQYTNPKSGLTFWDGPRPKVAFPRDQLATPAQALPEIVGLLNPLIRSDEKALQLRGLILKNDAEGIRKLLLSSGRIPRSTMEIVRRAYIGPAANPIIALQEEPGPCQISSATWVYLIGGVYVTAFQENICNPTN